MSEYGTATEPGFLLSGREWQVIVGASALMALNVLLMYVFVATPLAVVNQFLFAVPIVGVLVFGAAIVGGELIAEKGITEGRFELAVAGVAVLQGAFGTFGAGVLSMVSPGQIELVLGITALVTALMTALIGTYIYARSSTFEHYRTWSMGAFLAGLAAIFVGTFVSPVLLLGFALIFLGFLFRLGWEIARIRDGRIESVSLQAVGLYIAVAGVFVHVLQIVIRMAADQ